MPIHGVREEVQHGIGLGDQFQPGRGGPACVGRVQAQGDRSIQVRGCETCVEDGFLQHLDGEFPCELGRVIDFCDGDVDALGVDREFLFVLGNKGEGVASEELGIRAIDVVHQKGGAVQFGHVKCDRAHLGGNGRQSGFEHAIRIGHREAARQEGVFVPCPVEIASEDGGTVVDDCDQNGEGDVHSGAVIIRDADGEGILSEKFEVGLVFNGSGRGIHG